MKIFAESPDLNADQILSREVLTMPYRTVVSPEERKMEVLNQALKEVILRELQ